MPYRRRAGGADESLFGSTATKTTLATNSVVISKGELEKMRQSSVMWTAADETKKRLELEAAQEQKQKAARERKARMLALASVERGTWIKS